MLTTTLAKLAEEKGAKIILGSATKLSYKDDGQAVESVTYTERGVSYSFLSRT